MTKRRLIAFIGWVSAALILAVGGKFFVDSPSVAYSPALNVSAAISLQTALNNIKTGCTNNPDYNVTVYSFGASGTLANNIKNNTSSPDLFVSADEATMDGLQSPTNYTVSSTRCDLVKNKLVVIEKLNAGITITALDSTDVVNNSAVQTVYIGNPSTVPAGQYAKDVLTTNGIYTDLVNNGKLDSSSTNVAAVVTNVANSASNAIGFVYTTDLQANTATVQSAYTIPDSQQPSIIYPIAVLSNSTQQNNALTWEKFLYNDSCAQGKFTDAGFTTLSICSTLPSSL